MDSSTVCELGYWRDSTGNRDDEIDLVLIDDSSRAVGIEIKLTTTPSSQDFRGPRRFREDCQKTGRKFVNGFLICTCKEVQQFETNLWAIPYHLLGNYQVPPKDNRREKITDENTTYSS